MVESVKKVEASMCSQRLTGCISIYYEEHGNSWVVARARRTTREGGVGGGEVEDTYEGEGGGGGKTREER